MQNYKKKSTMYTKDFRENYYTGLKGIYFYKILEKIIKIGNLKNSDVRVLDFGCGTGKLKKLLPGKVIGYDILHELSDVSDWKKEKFNVVVANAVFYLFTAEELTSFLEELQKYNSNIKMICVTRKKYPILNNILKYIAGEPDAHADTKLLPKQELDILQKKMRIIKKSDVFLMSNVYLMEFKNMED